MARALVLIVAAAAVFAACGDGSTLPSASGSPVPYTSPTSGSEVDTAILATATPRLTTKDSTPCYERLPTATLQYNDSVQTDAKVAFNWKGRDCVVQGHPDITLPLPREPLHISQGARAELRFSATPNAVSAYVWTPNYALAKVDSLGKVQVPFDDLRLSTRKDLATEPAADQQLALDALPPGDYAVEVSATWPEGSTGYAFRVRIEDATGVP